MKNGTDAQIKRVDYVVPMNNRSWNQRFILLKSYISKSLNMLFLLVILGPNLDNTSISNQ